MRILSGLALIAGFLVAPAAARAMVVGSPHDFSATGPFTTTLGPSGACSVCHVPHGAADSYALWPRNLDAYRSALVNDGDPSSVPNYVLGPTIQCYDCHDYHGGGGINNVPSLTADFTNSQHRPQNIAFGFTKNGTGDMTEDPPRGTVSGYYENKPPYSSSYGANPNLALPADLAMTGGHYFKHDPDDAGGVLKVGDKLPCRDCHDPHAWNGSWQAFIKPNLGGSTGWGRIVPSNQPAASTYMANEFTTALARDDDRSRQLCIACHGDSNTLPPVNFSDISSAYSTLAGAVVRPPDTIADHKAASAVACVSCHKHNSIDASCSDCHGYPPGEPAPTRYPSTFTASPDPDSDADSTTRGSHAMHTGAKTGGAPNSFSVYSFPCETCHYASAGAGSSMGYHGNDNVSVIIMGVYTKAGGMYDSSNYYNQAYYPAGPTGQLDNSTGSTGWGYASPARAGWNSCQFVYCHSAGRVKSAMADNEYRRPQFNTGPLGCNGCHGDTGADNTSIAYGMPAYANGGPGTDNANSHGAHVVNAGYECSVCHAGTATGSGAGRAIVSTTPTIHVNGSREVGFAGGGTYTGGSDKRCAVSCHNSEALPLAQQPQWGSAGSATCTACHVTSAADSDQYLTASDTWFQNGVAANLDNTEWTWSGHGRPAASGNYEVSGRPAADLLGGGTGDNPCLYCHDPNVGHKDAANPFRLKDQTGVSGFSGLAWNATCLVCHRKTPAPPGYDPDGSATVYASKAAAAAFTDNNHWGVEHGATNGGKFCWDCHDPHGDRNSSGTGNIFMVHKQQLARQTDGTYGYRGSGGALTNNAPVFTNVATGTNYADNTTYAGICQVCHTQPTTGHYRYDYGDGHNAGSRCTTCHAHDAAFAASKCEGCHGGENGELAPVNGAPKVTRYWKTSGHGHAAGPAVTCENCHDVASPSPSTHTTSGSGIFNTYRWNGDSNDNTNANTSHLKSFYVTTGTASQIQVNFDSGCYNGPGGGVACHAQRFIKNHRHTKDAGNVMQFGRHNTTNNPKGFTWYAQASYESDFYKSRSPWVIQDTTTNTGAANPPSDPYFGTCVSCHDPHGTDWNVTDNTYGALGFTNHMVRGRWFGAGASQFCNGACHK